jgi:protein-tyrosine kinase
MNLIERASRRMMGLNAEKSVVEKAAERLAAPSVSAGGGAQARLAPSAAAVSADGGTSARRGTQQEIFVDFERLRGMGMAPPGEESVLGDEIRLIKRPLIDNVFSPSGPRLENANLIMVTSAGPNDGKTFVAANLAMSMASEHGVHVLLIDADLTHPSIPPTFGFRADQGLIDAVTSATPDLTNILVRTSIDNLTLMPAGRHVALANELLASPKMGHFVDDIARRYSDRIVIFDSPPLLARSEASVLARHVGQIVFVVEAERTTRSAITDALRLVDQNKYIGVVLNKTPSEFLREGFGQYNYNYRYGYRYADGASGGRKD